MSENKYCEGHEELRDIALATSNNLKHLRDELHTSNENVNRFMAALSECNRRITELEVNGAKISQNTAKDLYVLKEEFDDLSRDVAVMKNDSGWSYRIASYVLGIFSGLIVGIVVIWFQMS